MTWGQESESISSLLWKKERQKVHKVIWQAGSLLVKVNIPVTIAVLLKVTQAFSFSYKGFGTLTNIYIPPQLLGYVGEILLHCLDGWKSQGIIFFLTVCWTSMTVSMDDKY